MAQKYTPEEIRQGQIDLWAEQLQNPRTSKFMTEVLQSGIRRIKAGNDVEKVCNWVVTLEKMWNSFT
jgi:hypothetical protein